MAETKPTKVARWATDANRTLEPSSGEKDTGWQVQKKPPARKMNWLFNFAYKWFAWFNERMFDGGTANDFEVTGVDVITGTDQDGGDLVTSGGSSTGSGSSDLDLKAAVAGASGSTVRTPETFLKLNGVLGALQALKSFVTTGATDALKAESSGSGDAIVGESTSSGWAVNGDATGGTGYGVGAQGKQDPSVTGSASLYIKPQTGLMASPEKGATEVFDTGGKYTIHNGSGWDRYVPQSHSAVAVDQETPNATTETFEEKYTIPANSLRAGSTIRVTAFGDANWNGATGLGFRVSLGGTQILVMDLESVNLAGATVGWFLSAAISIYTTGAPGTGAAGGFCRLAFASAGGASDTGDSDADSITPDTTGALDVELLVTTGIASTINLRGLIVDVT